jgi:hypothetical protein
MTGQNNPSNPSALGHPQYGTKVLGIGDPVKHQQEGRGVAPLSNQSIEFHWLQRGRESDYTLRRISTRHGFELVPRHFAQQHMVLVDQAPDVVKNRSGVHVRGEDDLAGPSRTG